MDINKLILFIIPGFVLFAIILMGSFYCIFDPCALSNGVLLGLISSIIGSFIVLGILSWQRKRKFEHIQGEYNGFVPRKDEAGNETDELDMESQSSKAKITQLRENILSIVVEEFLQINSKGENLIWSGEMTMELETSQEKFGTVIWRYNNLDEGKYRFGFKRTIVREHLNGIEVYLIGEDGYGKEVFFKSSSINQGNDGSQRTGQ